MATILEVARWATCRDAVQWSELNEIAVALGDHIALFIPKLSFHTEYQKTRDRSALWHKLVIQTGIFREAELPLINPLHRSHFSLGEEQTYSDAVSIAWSPLGLARHGRCALAVLTSNHVLSIWASKTNPTEPASWTRVLVVNHAIVDPDSQNDFRWGSDNGKARQNLRLPWRIRSFAWGPVITSPQHHYTEDGRNVEVAIDRQSIAVTNDAGELIVLEIRSPQQILIDQSRQWSCHVVLRDTVSSRQHVNPKPGNITGELFRKGTFATNLAWCKWQTNPNANKDTDASMLAYRIGSQLYVRSLLSTIDGNHSLMLAPSMVTVAGDHEGPVKLFSDVSATCSSQGCIANLGLSYEV